MAGVAGDGPTWPLVCVLGVPKIRDSFWGEPLVMETAFSWCLGFRVWAIGFGV